MSSHRAAQKNSLAPSLSGGPTEGEVITIEKLVYGGQGIGHLNGRSVFVPSVLPGERVKVQIIRRRRQFFEANLLEILKPSPNRVDPPCPYFGKCGGCQWQHIDYETQLEWKQKILKETLERVGKIENPKVLPTIPSPKQLGWRSRVTIHADAKGNVGFFAEGTHQVVDVEKCLIVEEGINKKIKDLREKIREKREERKEKGEERRDYELRITEEEGFTQVNREQNENLKGLVREWTFKLPHDTVVELFCGSGNFTEVLIPLAKKIIAIDSDRSAIELASLRLTHLHTYAPFDSAQGRLTHFLCTDAIKFFTQKLDFPVDLLILDPPRDGAAGVVEGVIKNRPQNILYISCNPATLARDLKFLKEFANYQLVQSQPIDMFPQSYHIESLSLITQGLLLT